MSRHSLALVAIVTLGAVLRTIALDWAPPGLFYDEAANAIDALHVLAGQHAIFFPGNQGREPLHIYAVALATALLGPGWMAARLPAVVAGTFTIVVTYFLGREVGGRRLGLLAALLLATSFWHVSLSRLGFRAAWVPLVVALSLLLLLAAMRTGNRAAAAASGLTAGIGIYTYIAARLVPLLLLLLAGHGAVVGRVAIARRVLPPLVAGAAVATPLAIFFARNPHAFWERAQNLSGGDVGALDRTFSAAGIFLWAGDAVARHNLPGRPVFDPLTGGLFLVGLVVCLVRWRQPGYLALPLTCATMLLPQALASGEPHFLRAAGVLPAAQVIAAVGLDRVLARVHRRRLAGALIGGLALFWVVTTARDYFGIWAPARATYFAFEGQGRDAARLLASLAPVEPAGAGSPIYRGQPTYYLEQRDAALVPFDDVHGVVVPTEGGLVVLSSREGHTVETRLRLGRPVAVAGRWRNADASAAVVAHRPEPGLFDLPRPIPARIGEVVATEAYRLPTVVGPGAELRLELAWRVLGQNRADTHQFAHVVRRDSGGERVWSLEDVLVYPSRFWRGGERVLTLFRLRLPPDAPIGAYWIATGFYEPGSLRRLPVTDAQDRPAGDRLLVGPFKVWDKQLTAPRPAQIVAEFAEDVVLAAVEIPPSAAPGKALPIRLTWWSSGPTAQDLTVFVHLLDAQRRERAGADALPVEGSNPTSLWQFGETIQDDRVLPLPASLEPGEYEIEVGLYDPTSGTRLPLVSAPDRLGDAAIVGRVKVR